MTTIDNPEDSVFEFEPADDAVESRIEKFFDQDAPQETEAVAAATAIEWSEKDQRRLRARKVRRLVRHVEPWSVLKVSLLFNFCMWIVVMVAGVILWNAAESSGTLEDIESFVEDLLNLDDFEFVGDAIFNAVALGGLVVVVAATGFAVLMAVLLNLISDLTGGIRVTVVEEETARPESTLPSRD